MWTFARFLLLALFLAGSLPCFGQSGVSVTPENPYLSNISLTPAQWNELKTLLSGYKQTTEQLQLDLTSSQESLKESKEALTASLGSLSECKALLTNSQTLTEELKASLKPLKDRTEWLESERWIWGGAGLAVGIGLALLFNR